MAPLHSPYSRPPCDVVHLLVVGILIQMRGDCPKKVFPQERGRLRNSCGALSSGAPVPPYGGRGFTPSLSHISLICPIKDRLAGRSLLSEPPIGSEAISSFSPIITQSVSHPKSPRRSPPSHHCHQPGGIPR